MSKATNLAKTLSAFFNELMPSYVRFCVPTSVQAPYITYDYSGGTFADDTVVQVLVYSNGKSLAELHTNVDKLVDYIGEGISVKGIDGGFLYLRLGSPAFQDMPELNDNNLSVCNVSIIMRNLIC